MTHPHADDLVARARLCLRTERVGRSIRAHGRVSSTNTVAGEWAEAGAPDGAVVYAEHQTHGRGRLGRRWTASAGLNLTFSVILRPRIDPEKWGMVTIAACVAVSDAIDAFVAPLRTSIKWPNDILLHHRKCCGMLLEAPWPQRPLAGHSHVVLGIGLNVNQDEFPEELAEQATSLLLETGRPISRADLLAEILNRLENSVDEASADPKTVRRRYLSRMKDLNEPLRFRYAENSGDVRGTAIGLDEGGGIILQTDGGLRVFYAGEVTRSS